MVSRVKSSGSDPERTRRFDETGIALIVALLVMVIMTLLGIPFLLMGETENRIAQNERFSLQALYAAESGAKVVVRWFDRPGNVANVVNPTLAVIDRTQRMIDADGDPSTDPVEADGTAFKPWYKQGIDNNDDDLDDVFRKPYRGGFANTLMGTEDGPDMVIDETASDSAKTFLENLSQSLLAEYPSSTSDVRARITRIEIYQPPYVRKAGVWKRYGVGTIKVVARIYQGFADGSEEILAERMVKVVINEIPYNPGDLGPLHSCDTLDWNGDFTVHWGIATAVSTATLHNNHGKLAASLPRVAGMQSIRLDLLWGWDDEGGSQWKAYYEDLLEEDGYEIEDPWLRFVTGGTLVEPSDGADQPQPWPFTWTGPGPEDGAIPFHPGGGGMTPPGVNSNWDGTHANVLQDTNPDCPKFPYDEWKNIAKTGGLDTHYYVWHQGDEFKENGAGPAMGFEEITHNKKGLFFFDTKDQEAPEPDNSNLTPPIKISGKTWCVTGMVYLNALEFETTGVNGCETIFRAPGEPFQDKNQNGKWDTDENWVNLDYPTQLKPQGATQGRFFAKKKTGAATRDPFGPSIVGEASVRGIFFTNGAYNSKGNAVYYGSMIAKTGIGVDPAAAGTPDHYWDESLKDFPPDDWDLPRVRVSRWETDL